jgi:hypothetical protein
MPKRLPYQASRVNPAARRVLQQRRTNCPVDAELHERGVDREKNDDA